MPPVLLIEFATGQSPLLVPAETAVAIRDRAYGHSRTEMVEMVIESSGGVLSREQAKAVLTLLVDRGNDGSTDFETAEQQIFSITVSPSGSVTAIRDEGSKKVECVLTMTGWTTPELPGIHTNRLQDLVDSIYERDPAIFLHLKFGRNTGAN